MTVPLRLADQIQRDTTQVVTALRVTDQGVQAGSREVADELPVAMVFDGSSLAVMLATPNDIEDFALGFAFTEGYVADINEIAEFEHVAHQDGIEARFWLSADRSQALARRRRASVGPIGCGLCGIDSLEQANRPLPRIQASDVKFSYDDINGASRALRCAQPVHDRCRAAHAAGFLLPKRGLILAREEVGRHNALDKLTGALLRQGVDPATGAIVITSRISLELVQKCAMVGCPMLVAVSAPTAHAIRQAEISGLTLAANAKGEGFDLYDPAGRLRA